MADGKPVIAVIGGTGKEGGGLALRWARAGYRVIVGSRDAARARDAAASLAERAGDGAALEGMDNPAAAAACDVAVLTVPFAAQLDTLAPLGGALDGKVLIDVTVPLVPPRVSRVQLPEGGSAVLRAQALLGEKVRVVSAFQNIAAEHLADPAHAIECDVLICGDDKDAREAAIRLAEAAGMRAWHAGPLANSAAAEALTSVLVSINRTYRIAGAGIRITGAPGSAGGKG